MASIAVGTTVVILKAVHFDPFFSELLKAKMFVLDNKIMNAAEATDK